ncbi:sensor histidine kinase [uncultured Polaribacter sp.]|uniref:sensor histidine kinase n=1 Tax=uncultured Polaribacter sp. TaxID=174711 RepID=UPI00261379DC|nr:sensor histidine kinase [uncultured Polaribacter sp.]
MKIFNKEISLKQILIVIILLLISNSTKIFFFYSLRTNTNSSDIDFYDYFDHISVFIFSILSVLSVIFSWKIINKIDITNTILKFVKVYILSFFIFTFLGVFIDYTVLHVILSSKSEYNIVARSLNTMSVAFILADIFALTSAFLYFRQSQKITLELEQTEKEKAILQSQILQKNLEPHFLFNNLSVLSGLARKKPNQIEDFIEDFSDVYHYYLKHGKKQLVELKDELSFLISYMNLMEKRFGNAYKIQNSIKNTTGFIIPCSLQLCIENAIKHNKASEENPLLISLSSEEDTLIIKNKINKVDFTLGTGTGNDYLKRQYQLNFNKDVIFTETNHNFIVEIPLISEI